MKKLIIAFILILVSINAQALDYGEVDIHGFLSQGYLWSDKHNAWTAETEKGTFEFNEMGLNFGTRLTDNLRVGIQLFAKDLGEVGNDEVVVDWVFGDYRFRNWLGIRIGKIKKPTGLYNQSRDIDSARAEIFLPSCIYNERYRAAALTTKGFGIYGTLPFDFEYQIVHGVMDITADSQAVITATSSLGLPATGVDVENSTNGKISWTTPLDGLMIAATLLDYDFTVNTAFGDFQSYGEHFLLGVEYLYDNITFAAEYKTGSNRARFGGAKVSSATPLSYYAKFAYRFNDLIEAGTYYAEEYTDEDDKDGDRFAAASDLRGKAWLKDLALFTRIDINEYWIVKIEGHAMDGFVGGIDTIGTETDEDWFLGAAKVSYTF